jgi:hypothetical protein
VSDSMRPRADDYVPPCMDLDSTGPHQFGKPACIHCGKQAEVERLSAIVAQWRESARVFRDKGGDICADIASRYDECAEQLHRAIAGVDALPPAPEKEGE